MRRILWFRRDLRIEDNPLLSLEGEVLPVFIFDTNILNKLEADDRRISMIYDFVIKLKKQLQTIGLDLKIFYGEPKKIFESLKLEEFDEVVASGDYDTYAKDRDREISHMIHFRYLNDTYLFKPNEVLKSDASPYLVYTPFYKKALLVLENKKMPKHERVVQKLYPYDYTNIIRVELMSFKEQSFVFDFHIDNQIKNFIAKLSSYSEDRDFLDKDSTSKLSVALRFGLVSIREVYRKVIDLKQSTPFIRQLIFRDYYAYLLFHFPTLQTSNYKGSFNGIENKELFEVFCKGQTGVPVVDAGVRELLTTGMMHNRVRMVVASFFTKDLLLPWQWGESFFAEHLLDYDSASNILSWQWSAGTGIDPQPYFRVFNPYLQSKKFDKEALYIKKHICELQDIDAKYLHNEEYLLKEKIKDYPQPIVNHKVAAKIAIEHFKK